MVEYIKELRPELGRQPLLKLENLGHGQVHIFEAGVGKRAAARVSQGSIGGRDEDRALHRVTAEVGKRGLRQSKGGSSPPGPCLRATSLILWARGIKKSPPPLGGVWPPPFP